MITPPYLQKGDRIGIIAPARFVTPEEIKKALDYISEWGVNIVPGQNLFAQHHQFAGTDEQRRNDLQAMLDDKSIRAILFARGGYGTMRIIDQLDFSRFASNPKWIAGYSDITVLHAHIEKTLGIETLHGPMLFEFDGSPAKQESFETLRKILFGQKVEYHIKPALFSKPGVAQAALTGGNLSMLYAMAGSASECTLSNKVLFIEDVDEYLYHIDRMMQQLKRSGKLDDLAGVVVGGMSKMHDNSIPFGKSAGEIISEYLKDHEIPVLMGFPAGHEAINKSLILGRTINLEVGKESAILQFIEGASSGRFSRWWQGKMTKVFLFAAIFFILIYLAYYTLILPFLTP